MSCKIFHFFSSKIEETSSGDIHIHLVLMGTTKYNDFLILKNYLLANQNAAEAYSKFKLKLINDGIIERKDYKKIKSEYVSNLLMLAREFFNKDA